MGIMFFQKKQEPLDFVAIFMSKIKLFDIKALSRLYAR